jgi:hypothetical protein
MPQEFYAHSVEGKPVSEWQRLEEHLKGTAELAKSFPDEFGYMMSCLKEKRIVYNLYNKLKM